MLITLISCVDSSAGAAITLDPDENIIHAKLMIRTKQNKAKDITRLLIAVLLIEAPRYDILYYTIIIVKNNYCCQYCSTKSKESKSDRQKHGYDRFLHIILL